MPLLLIHEACVVAMGERPRQMVVSLTHHYGVSCSMIADCCNGTQCASCVIDHEKSPEELLTPACLAECPPKDDLDRACAMHDACTFSFPGPRHLKCVPQGNFCACDCMLVYQANIAEVCAAPPVFACGVSRVFAYLGGSFFPSSREFDAADLLQSVAFRGVLVEQQSGAFFFAWAMVVSVSE